ncbi:MAG: RNA polymerase sigma factor [Methylococcaceae bacterium]
METLSDNAIMQKVQKGDIDQMGLLYERYHRHLFRFLYQMTHEKELSEDLVQNVFMRMLKYSDGFQGYGEFKTWMYRIARNIVYDHFRKVKHTPRLTDVKDYETSLPGEQFTDAAIEKEQSLRLLQAAMEKLSMENRELLILCRYEELKYQEIAKILNVSEEAVKVRVHRALKQLKSYYMQLEY